MAPAVFFRSCMFAWNALPAAIRHEHSFGVLKRRLYGYFRNKMRQIYDDEYASDGEEGDRPPDFYDD